MFKKTKKIGAIIINLFVGALLFANLLIPITSAASPSLCTWINNQNGSAPKADPNADPGDFKDKIAVITEEPLGNADNSFSYRCARKTVCSVTPPATPKDTSSGAGGGGSGATASSPTPQDKKLTLRTCLVEFSEVSACSSASSSADINESFKDPTIPFTTCEIVQVYVSGAGTDLLYHYVGQIYKYVAVLGGTLAVLFLIIAGIMITTAGDNSEQVGNAKKMVAKCITGLVILFLSAVILYTINPNFFVY